MWLLNATTCQLEQFLDERLMRRKYATLSHTWGDEELTFQDLQNGLHTFQHKKGYVKVRYTLDQSLMDGQNYAWVDTCCIDKTSSAELSEAINSMYKWYENSSVCYAYLADIPGHCPKLDDELVSIHEPPDWDLFDEYSGHGSNRLVSSWSRGGKAKGWCEEWSTVFAGSRWFTRGWTLQELIAPKEVCFFGGEWNYVGDKTELSQTLATITGISVRVLRNDIHVHKISAAQRMSWAALRETTRTEDEAYSLMGIFDINMPLLYGEGGKAYIRLQEEIMRKSSDLSLLGWSSPLDQTGGHIMEPSRPYGVVLATSPVGFGNAQKIVQCDIPAHVTWELTNEGIRVGLPILEHEGDSEGNVFGILNCCYEDDLAGPIALPLETVLLAAEEFRPGAHSPSVPTYYQRVARGRPPVIPLDVALAAITREIVILFESRGMPWLTTPRNTMQVWLQQHAMLQDGWKVLAAFPRSSWNLASGVMTPSSDDSYGKSGCGCLKFGKGTNQFIIAFCHLSRWNFRIAILDLIGLDSLGSVDERLESYDVPVIIKQALQCSTLVRL
ncbi:hypothetical protein LTR85_007234 [Meristemomyces frigidus]|nr:hypothetical protein LTR85_007234 [Meristemomyces frigidus]